MIDPSKYLIKNTSAMRSFVTRLDKKGALLPVILLEASVTAGRTYQAYKRDGFVEARERITEESLGAVFWLYGATLAGKLFDKIGQKFGKVPKDMPDVGRDAARGPFVNYIEKITKLLKLSPEKAAKLEKVLAKYSVGKTGASIITACLFIGYVVPKVNQAITKHIFGRMNEKDPKHEKAPDPNKNRITLKDARAIFWTKDVSINSVENFKAREDNKAVANKANKTLNSVPSFKANADSLLRIVQNFEENAVWKLMGTDVGTVTGRTANARNNDERVEILFRDISSIYFYCFSMPAIVAFMNKKDKFGGLNTKLNPMSAMEVHNHLVNKMAQAGKDNMTVEEFKKFALGNKNFDKNLYSKIFPAKASQEPKKVFFGLFKVKPEKVYETITLDNFEKIIDANVKDTARAKELKLFAREMSELQPERVLEKDGKKFTARLLTESQVQDVFMGGEVRKPEFMKRILNHIFEDGIVKPENYDVNDKPLDELVKTGKKIKKLSNPLGNKYKFISIKDIEDRRKRVIGYVKSIVQDAENSKTNITWERMRELNKRNMKRNGAFMLFAMGVSSLFLSTIIPKIQYYITFLRTGKNTFPGVENMGKVQADNKTKA